jgi:flagellar basal-body rod protein FlgG
MFAQQTRVEVISNNIANMSTTAYEARRAEFSDLMYQKYARPGAISSDAGTQLPSGIQIGLGVRPASVTIMAVQGNLQQTGGEMDLAIEGDGFFEIQMPDGTQSFTRDGSLKLSAEGQIVTSEGYPVTPAINVPQDVRQISINKSGEVYVYQAGNIAPTLVGQLQLTTFVNEKGLEAMGDNLFKETTASGSPIVGNPNTENRGTVNQGYLEASSVNVVYELTQLIEAQRGYEMNSKVMTATDQIMGTTSQIR